MVSGPFRLLNLGDSEIQHLGPVAVVCLGKHDVFALQIAMDDALLMRGVKRSGNLANDFDGPIERHWPLAFDDIFESAAIQIFHHQEDNPVFGFSKIGNADRVRMRNPRGGLGFARKARHHDVVARQRWTKHFDRDDLFHHHVLAAVNRAHAAALDQLFDEIFFGERLSQQRILHVLKHLRIKSTQRAGIRIFLTAKRTNFHVIDFVPEAKRNTLVL